MPAYYNEHEPYAAQWLRNLIAAGHIAPGDVDERDIQDVTPDDLTGYTQCHFFAGIGGWSYALRQACWPDDRPVWTGSCPCQPLSSAGQQKGAADERHLWPAFFELIAECHPPTAFGEQVGSRLGREWMSGVRLDLESVAYAVGGADLPAASLGAPHIRQRLWWVAHAKHDGSPSEQQSFRTEDKGRLQQSQRCGAAGGLGDARHSAQLPLGAVSEGTDATEPERGTGRLADADVGRSHQDARWRCDEGSEMEGPWDDGRLGGLGDAAPHGRVEERQDTGGRCERSATQGREQRPWDDSRLIPCADARARRIPQSRIFPLADGVPGRTGSTTGGSSRRSVTCRRRSVNSSTI